MDLVAPPRARRYHELEKPLPIPGELSLGSGYLLVHLAMSAFAAVDPIWVLSESARARRGRFLLSRVEGEDKMSKWGRTFRFYPVNSL